MTFAETSARATLLAALLRHASGGAGAREAPAGTHGSDAELDWVLASGFAPLVLRARDEGALATPPRWDDRLIGADLTARVRHGSVRATAEQVIDACDATGVCITLLKGISACDELYPEPHLRPMGDVDVLVDREAVGRVEAALLDAGYRHADSLCLQAPGHHRPAIMHPAHRVWVELHTGLFPPDAGLADDAFDTAGASVASRFGERAVRRLAPELQLPYVATGWARELCGVPVHPGFVGPLVDASRLAARGLDWDAVTRHAGRDARVALSLALLLGVLDELGVAVGDARVRRDVLARQRIAGPRSLRAAARIAADQVVRGWACPSERILARRRTVLRALLEPGAPPVKLARIIWRLA